MRVGGDLLTALLTAGAFAAFLATSSGLTIAVAGVISQDVMSKRLEGVTAFRLSAVVAVVVPFLLSFLARDVAVATVVGLAFAMAAATFCPLLVLGIWWRGLTDAGALAGLLVGGALTGGRGDRQPAHRPGAAAGSARCSRSRRRGRCRSPSRRWWSSPS